MRSLVGRWSSGLHYLFFQRIQILTWFNSKPGLFFAGYASSAVVEAIVYEFSFCIFLFLSCIELNFGMQVIFGNISSPFVKTCRPTAQQTFKLLFFVWTKLLLETMLLPSKLSKNHSIWEMYPILMMWLERVRWPFSDNKKPRSYNIVRNNLWDWQSLQVTSGPGAQFYNFCDALEVKNGVSAPASGWGLDHALDAWGSYWRDFYLASSKAIYNIKECQHIDSFDLTVCGDLDAEFVDLRPASRCFPWLTYV